MADGREDQVSVVGALMLANNQQKRTASGCNHMGVKDIQSAGPAIAACRKADGGMVPNEPRAWFKITFPDSTQIHHIALLASH